MSDPIRFELTGKDSKAWSRIFGTLTGVIERAIDALAPKADKRTKRKAKQVTQDLAEITKGWLKAKIERPALENESIIADIAKKFEELKLIAANREHQEVETELKRVELEEKRLELWEKRMTVAVKWLGFLHNHVVQDDSGGLVLLLTNQDLTKLLSEVKGMQQAEPK